MAMEVFFVTGTGTDVGKTYCAAQFAKTCHEAGKRVGVYKPVASGCVINDAGELFADDAHQLWQAAGQPLNLHAVCPQRFAASLSPPAAAEIVGATVDEKLLVSGLDVYANLPLDVLIIEGAGGLFSPLSASLLNIDFAIHLRTHWPELRVVLVAPNRLGTIHDCIATVRASESAGLPIDQIVLNQFAIPDASVATNADEIRRWTGRMVCSQIE